ncbi:hypothetical protein ACTXT7_008957 [Hymenolepis weldensis]
MRPLQEEFVAANIDQLEVKRVMSPSGGIPDVLIISDLDITGFLNNFSKVNKPMNSYQPTNTSGYNTSKHADPCIPIF